MFYQFTILSILVRFSLYQYQYLTGMFRNLSSIFLKYQKNTGSWTSWTRYFKKEKVGISYLLPFPANRIQINQLKVDPTGGNKTMTIQRISFLNRSHKISENQAWNFFLELSSKDAGSTSVMLPCIKLLTYWDDIKCFFSNNALLGFISLSAGFFFSYLNPC